MLKINNITKKYGSNTIFNNISFEVNKGEVISIVGKSGSGKSTLLKCINRLEEIDSGCILFQNKNILEYDLKDLRQNIGIVFQDYNLFDHLNVLENLTIGLEKIRKYNPETAKKSAIKLLKKVELVEKINNYPDELSGGQKQRIAIVRTLLMKPKIILLDEPTSALDSEMKQEVIKMILQMADEDMTLIVVSHEEDLVKKISDKIIEIQNGKVKIKVNTKKGLSDGKKFL